MTVTVAPAVVAVVGVAPFGRPPASVGRWRPGVGVAPGFLISAVHDRVVTDANDADGDESDVDAAEATHEDLAAAEARIEAAAEETDGPLSEFAHALDEATDESLRSVTHYDGERYDLLYRREDLRAGTDPETQADRTEALVMKALGDLRSDDEVAEYGPLGATVRYYEEVVVAVYPTDDWSGVVATFDREASPLVDAAVDRL